MARCANLGPAPCSLPNLSPRLPQILSLSVSFCQPQALYLWLKSNSDTLESCGRSLGSDEIKLSKMYLEITVGSAPGHLTWWQWKIKFEKVGTEKPESVNVSLLVRSRCQGFSLYPGRKVFLFAANKRFAARKSSANNIKANILTFLRRINIFPHSTQQIQIMLSVLTVKDNKDGG